ncbi:MAG: hypothetical protein F6K54_39955 [Okeania sp. SIO3B5]|nr:hypothetical protein [Okeania sp. SIO3B5]
MRPDIFVKQREIKIWVEYNQVMTLFQTFIDSSIRRSLNDYFQIHNQRLEEYLRMKFNWD